MSIIELDAGFASSSSPEYRVDEKGANNARRRVVVVIVVVVVVVVASRPGDPSSSRLEAGLTAFCSFGTFGLIGFGLIAEPRATSSACSSA
jgi:hypothetical protein